VLGYMSAVLRNSGKKRAALILQCFTKNFFDTGKAGLTLACFDVLHG
jgi:hypothetical protein